MADPADAHDEVDWFGHPIATPRGDRAPVPCPRCGQAFTDAASYATHLRDAHGVTDPRRPPSQTVGRIQRWWRGLRFLPLWFVLPLNVVLVWLVVVSVRDPLWNPVSSLLVRLALLPGILLLVARVAGREP